MVTAHNVCPTRNPLSSVLSDSENLKQTLALLLLQGRKKKAAKNRVTPKRDILFQDQKVRNRFKKLILPFELTEVGEYVSLLTVMFPISIAVTVATLFMMFCAWEALLAGKVKLTSATILPLVNRNTSHMLSPFIRLRKYSINCIGEKNTPKAIQ